jgi:plastocyanin
MYDVDQEARDLLKGMAWAGVAALLAMSAAIGISLGADGALAAPAHVAGTAGVDPGEVRAVSLSLSSFNLTPSLLHLKAGQPILLRIVNESPMAHDLTAPEFFEQSSITPADRATVVSGKVALKGHEKAMVRLTPKAGRYAMKCSHRLHKMFGMSGTILVD